MRLTCLAMALICLTALFVAAQDNADRDVQSKTIALEKAWNQAYKSGDRKALDALLDNQIVLELVS
jgi:hypothetical protein